MSFLDYLLIKAALFIGAAFVWGIFCGLTGRSLSGARRGNRPAEDR